MLDEYLWVEKYRPKRIADTILPVELKTTFQTFVDQKNVPNLLLSGGPGVGKTTVARAMLEELECDYIVINGSMNGNIDTLRNEILNFASAVSLGGGRKYIVLDESDYLNSNSTQPALRNFMEEFSKNCGFILTCNYKNRIIKPLHSRCSVIDFVIPKDCKPKLAAQFFKRVEAILQTEQVKYDRTVVGTVIQKHFPDWRRVLNELQRYSATGAIDSGILSNLADVSINQVLQSCKAKDFDSIRKWVHDNSDQEQTNIFRAVYEHAHELADRKSIPELIVIIADYSYKAAFVADHEINLVAFFVELMMRIEWKD
jgi:DNA polymerase III delta prime subunit